MQIFLPDYEKSILNLTSSLMRNFGLTCFHPGLSLIDSYLQQNFNNVVFLTLDGMGSSFLRNALPESSFLRKHHTSDLTSVYPCTTTAATTTMQSGLSPSEHGWLGWNAWFKEYGAIIDLFLDRDSLSGATVYPSPAGKYLAYETISSRINAHYKSSEICRTVMPHFAPDGVNSFEQMTERIIDFCRVKGRKLVIAYWYEPDTLMHKYGPDSTPVIDIIEKIDDIISSMAECIEDTLLIITADHGQIEVKEEIFLDDNPELMKHLVLPPTLESRAASLFVKNGHHQDFEIIFNEIFGKSYLLLKRQQVYEMGILGPGQPHPKTDDFIGDYLACATGGTLLRFIGNHDRERYYFKGHHAGLCEDEMIVPLIVSAC